MPRIRADGGLIGRTNDPTALVASGMWSLKSAEKANRAALWPTSAYVGTTDPYFNLTSLLIHGDGANGANNTVFADQSTNGYTVTTSGKPMQGTFTPYSPAGWSNYLPTQAGGNIVTPSNSAFGLPGVFTLEFFFNASSLTAGSITGVYSAGGFNVYYDGTRITPNLYGTGNIFNSTFTSITLGKWYHIVVRRDSNNLMTMYVDGVSVGSTTTSTTYTTGTWAIGNAFNMYISNLRITNTDVYGGAPTVPTSALTAVTGTQLLTCQDNRFKDNSTNAFTLTPAGTTSVQAFSPFAPSSPYSAVSQGGSAYFNGTADYLTLPNNMTVVGSNAYTLEGWFYPTTVSAGEIPLVKLYNATQTIELRIVSSKIQGRINGSATIVGGNTTLYPNQWYHFALVKPSSGTSTAVLYLNGVAESTTASDTTTYTAFTTPRIGANQTPSFYFTGWAAGVRLLNGTAQYTGNFTPPTTPFTNISTTLFLVNSTNAGIIDNATRNNITTYGSSSISTTQSKFGGSSIGLNGTTDYIQFKPGVYVPQNTAYTFECWFYLNNTTFSTYYTLLGQSVGGTGGQLNIRIVNATTISVDQLGLSAQSFTIPTLSAGQWYHIAVTRNTSNAADVWLNGTKSTTGTVTMDKNYPSASDLIGANNDSGLGKYFPGYIDDVRFTIGYARYTANFSVANYVAFLDS